MIIVTCGVCGEPLAFLRWKCSEQPQCADAIDGWHIELGHPSSDSILCPKMYPEVYGNG